MLLSMTGFGKATKQWNNRNIKIEIKSLNGKMMDMRMKMPNRYREKEIEIRKIISENAFRGKLDVAIYLDGQTGDDEFDLNKDLFKRYLRELKSIQDEEGIEGMDLAAAVMRFPNVVQAVEAEITDDEWSSLKACLLDALSHMREFRLTEGQAMENSIRKHVTSIQSLLERIDPLDEERFAKVRKRIKQSLDDHLNKDQIDENRMEQEILFYLEKLDITEEKVRLGQHCIYFDEILTAEDVIKGKKLGFISQEIGREINTLGAKAQSSDIQKLVVSMKDELESIKELMLNTL